MIVEDIDNDYQLIPMAKIDEEAKASDDIQTYAEAFVKCQKVYDMTNIYCTPDIIFEMGACICDKCGKLNSVDYKICKACDNEIIIFRK